MKQTLTIGTTLPGLNEIIDASQSIAPNTSKTHKGFRISRYSKMKSEWCKHITILCRQQQIRPVTHAHFEFTWYEQSRQRDPDNISGGGHKLIFDALKHAGVIPNDGWSQVLGIRDYFKVDHSRVGVVVEIITDQPPLPLGATFEEVV